MANTAIISAVCETGQERMEACAHQSSPVSPTTSSVQCNTFNLRPAEPNSGIFVWSLPTAGLSLGVAMVIIASQRTDSQTDELTTAPQPADGWIFTVDDNIIPSTQL